MRRNINRATAPTTILVANLTGQVDANGNPIKARTGFTHQHIMGDRGSFAMRGAVINGGTPAPATATITVVNNDFSDPAVLILGAYELVSGLHFTVGADVNATATNLAAAIDNLGEFSASALAAVVSIEGPTGLAGSEVFFKVVFEGAITNYTLVPNVGVMVPGNPRFGTPTVLP